MSIKMGTSAEQAAKEYLQEKGLVLKLSNFRCKLGEIDLIMQEGVYLVFVEVRSRSSASYGNALESITYAKQQKIKKAAAFYLSSNKLHDKYPARFDVVSLQGSPWKIE